MSGDPKAIEDVVLVVSARARGDFQLEADVIARVMENRDARFYDALVAYATSVTLHYANLIGESPDVLLDSLVMEAAEMRHNAEEGSA